MVRRMVKWKTELCILGFQCPWDRHEPGILWNDYSVKRTIHLSFDRNQTAITALRLHLSEKNACLVWTAVCGSRSSPEEFMAVWENGARLGTACFKSMAEVCRLVALCLHPRSNRLFPPPRLPVWRRCVQMYSPQDPAWTPPAL